MPAKQSNPTTAFTTWVITMTECAVCGRICFDGDRLPEKYADYLDSRMVCDSEPCQMEMFGAENESGERLHDRLTEWALYDGD